MMAFDGSREVTRRVRPRRSDWFKIVRRDIHRRADGRRRADGIGLAL